MTLERGALLLDVQEKLGSDETLVAQHPWVDDVQAELKRVADQKRAEMDAMTTDPFAKRGDDQ